MNKYSKKISVFAILILCILLSFVLIACTGNQQDNSNNSGDNSQTVKTVPIFRGITLQDNLIKKENINSGNLLTDYSIIDDIIENDLDDNLIEDIFCYSTISNKAYITLNMYNPDEFEILSFVMNGKKYQSYQFSIESDSEHIILPVSMPNNGGLATFKVEQIKYIDDTEIKNCIMEGNDTINVGVGYENAPSVITEINKSYTSINFNITLLDKENVIEETSGQTKIYLFEENKLVGSEQVVKGQNTIEFNNLTKFTNYSYVIASIYDMYDENGRVINMLSRDLVKTLDYVDINKLEVNKNSLSFIMGTKLDSLVINDAVLYKNDEMVESKNGDCINFSNLSPNTEYTVIINYLYKNENYKLEFPVKTESFVEPSLNVSLVPTKQTISYEISVDDIDNTVVGYKVDLLKDGKVLGTLNTQSGIFENTLSNVTYSIKATLIYNLKDGSKDLTKFISKDVKTLGKEIPTCKIVSNVKDGKIVGSVDKSDVDNILTIKSIELYKIIGNELVESVLNTDKFSFKINTNTKYKVVVKYEYDLNDGNSVTQGQVEKDYYIEKDKPQILIKVNASDNSAYYTVDVIDINNVGHISKVELLKDGLVVKNISVTENTIKELKSNTKYLLRVTYGYDLDDGLGPKELVESKEFVTLKAVPVVTIESGEITDTSIEIIPNIVDPDSIGSVSKIELYYKGELIDIKTNSYKFEGLLSNNPYEISCIYSYDNGNGLKELTTKKSFKTLVKSEPIVTIDVVPNLYNISYNFKYNDETIKLQKVELIRDLITEQKSVAISGSFDNLLSNKAYQIKVTFTYDLNDGGGTATSNKVVDVNTLIADKPVVEVVYDEILDSSVKGHLNRTSGDADVTYKSISLYKNNNLISFVENQTVFQFVLTANSKYKIVIAYSYDLNDGNGVIDEEREYEFTSANKIPVVEIKIKEITDSSIKYTLDYIDENNIGKIKYVNLYKGQEFICSKSPFDTELTKLEHNTEYKFEVIHVFDLNDGTGSKEKTYIYTFRTLKLMPTYSIRLNANENQINMVHNLLDIDNASSLVYIKLFNVDTGEFVSEKNNLQDTTFNELLFDNQYRVEVMFKYQLNNKEINKKYEATVKTEALNSPSCSISLTANKYEIKYDYTYEDTSSVVRNEIVKIKHNGIDVPFDTNTKIASDLLSDSLYEIYVILQCDMGDGKKLKDFEFTKKITTEKLLDPTCDIQLKTNGNTISYNYEYNDLDKVVKSEDVKIQYKGQDIPIDRINKQATKLFNDALYEVIVILQCDMNDGRELKTVQFKKSIVTEKLNVPTARMESATSTQNTITPTFVKDDVDNILEYTKVEVYSGENLVSTFNYVEGLVINNLNPCLEYTFKTYYSYNMNDDRGEISDYFISKYCTMAREISIASFDIINERGTVLENEIAMVSLSLNNEDNVLISSITIDGQIYQVNPNKQNNIVVDISVGAGVNIRTYEIEKIEYNVNGYEFEQILSLNNAININVEHGFVIRYTTDIGFNKEIVLAAREFPYNLVNYVCDGYDFFGWYLEKSYTNEITKLENPQDISIFGKYIKMDTESELNYEYKVETDSYWVVGYNKLAKNVVIPSYYNGKIVDGIGPSAFENKDPMYSKKTINSIKLPDSIKIICKAAFKYTGLSMQLSPIELNIPKKIEIIEQEAFYGTIVDEVIIPETIKRIDRNGLAIVGFVFLPDNVTHLELETSGTQSLILNLVESCTLITRLDISQTNFVGYRNVYSEIVDHGKTKYGINWLNKNNENIIIMGQGKHAVDAELYGGEKYSILPSEINGITNFIFAPNAYFEDNLVLPKTYTSIPKEWSESNSNGLPYKKYIYFEGTQEEWESLNIHPLKTLNYAFYSERYRDGISNINGSIWYWHYGASGYPLNWYKNNRLTFDGNKAISGSMQSIDMNVTPLEFKLPKNNFIRPGAKFLYWSGYNKKFYDEQLIKMDYEKGLTLSAIWELYTYKITYNLGSDFVNNDPNNPSSYTIEDTITFGKPTRDGYRFLGWYETPEFSGQPIVKYDLNTIGDKILYAKWEQIVDSVIIYHDKLGVENPNPVRFTQEQLNIGLENLTKDGYNFVGWYTNENPQLGQHILYITEYKDYELYAVWEKVEYTITYYPAGGTMGTSPTKYTVEDAVTLVEPTKDGYTFVGWYDNEQLQGQSITTIEKGSIGNKTFYAKWEQVSNV